MASTSIRQAEGALPPPNGVTPNFENPSDRDALIFGVAGASISVSTLLVIVRTYTRFFVIKHRGWQDYVLLAAWALALAFIILLPLGIRNGSGVHQWNVTKSQFSRYLYLANIHDLLYTLAICLVKLAILIQLANIFAPTHNSMFYAIYTLAALTIMFYIACFFVRIFACIPREKIWRPKVKGECINSAALILASAVANTISDFVILVLPTVGVWALQMPLKKKAQLSGIFATGLFGCISSAIRLRVSINILVTGDETWEYAIVGLWCVAEITSGVACCCLPVFPKFFEHLLCTSSSSRHSTASGLDDPMNQNGRSSKPMNIAVNSHKIKWPDEHAMRMMGEKEYRELNDLIRENFRGTGGKHAERLDYSLEERKIGSWERI